MYLPTLAAINIRRICITLSCLFPALLSALSEPSGRFILESSVQARAQTRPEPDLSRMASEALGVRPGTVIVVDPKTGRLVRRVAHQADVQFESPPFELAQIITAYAALDSGAVDRNSVLACKELSNNLNIETALARNCKSVFRELSSKISPDSFKRAAETLGFIYYGVDRSVEETGSVRPVLASIPSNLSPGEFAELSATGQGMKARELHFAGLVSTIASGTTSYERFVAFVQRAAKAPAPPGQKLNSRALDVIRTAMVRSVDEGEASAAATLGESVAAAGGGREGAILIAYAPARSAQIAVVVNLRNGTQRDAAEVAGSFLKDFFSREKRK
jgi:cell division protein FtsI/penicillin-binding protein 2